MGLSVSFTGTYMQQAALLWHVSLIVPPGQKGLALGMVGLVRAVPIVLFALAAGVAADAYNRRTVMLVTNSAAVLVSSGLAWLAFSGVQVVWPVYALAALSAATSAFDGPSRHAMTPMLVPREHLPNAINLNSAMMQTASVAGPALGGLLIAQASVGAAYAFNAVTYLFVIVALVMMRDVPATARTPGARGEFSLAAAKEGLRFVFRSPIIRSTMILDFLATFFAGATALLPIFAQDILHVGADGYGLLAAAPAAGALAISLVLLPYTHRIVKQGVALVAAVCSYGLATIVFGMSTTLWAAFAALAMVGASDAVSTILRHLMRQMETPDAIRGRMTGINMVFYMGGPQLGEMEAGAVAHWIGARLSVMTGGLGCLVATALVVALTPELRTYRPPRVSTGQRDRASP